MSTYSVSRLINAPIHVVFDMISSPENFAKAIPDITKIEFLSDTQTGVGTTFLETRLHGKKEATVELKITEHQQNQHVRLVSDMFGTVWDSIFAVEEKNGQTELSLVMEARAYKFFAKIMNLMIKGMIQRDIEGDMDTIKGYCENLATQADNNDEPADTPTED